MQKIIFLFLVLITLSTKSAWADCPVTGLPSAIAGTQRFYNNTIEFCNGTTWKLIGAPIKLFDTTCDTVSEKVQVFNTAAFRMEYCKSSTSDINYVADCSLTSNACANAGEQQYDNTTNMMQFCNGANWINMGSTAGVACCPDGFIPVPADALSGTNANFCVSKYHMKAVRISNGHVDNNGDVPTAVISEYYPKSIKDGRPWNSLSYNDAVTKCASLGTNFHLITNQEWMTIAKSIENNPINWSGGAIGSGFLPRGHNDSNPNHALPVVDSSNPCDGTGNSNCAVPTSPDFAQKRTLTLSNGQIIWDMAGNINSWVASNISNDSISYYRTNCSVSPCIKQLNDTYNIDSFLGKYTWILSPFMYPPNPLNSTNQKAFLPANDPVWATAINYGATPYDQRGFGMIHWAAPLSFTPLTDIAMLRGGYHSQATTASGEFPAGLYSAFLTKSRVLSGLTSAGFRCVYTPPN